MRRNTLLSLGKPIHIILAAIVLLEGLYLIYLFRASGPSALVNMLHPAPPAVQSVSEWRRMVDRDPHVGEPLPIALTSTLDGQLMRIGSNGRPGGVLFIGQCADCALKYLKRWSELKKAHGEADFYVISTELDPATIRQFQKDNQISATFLVPRGKDLMGSYNAFYLPRVYGYDKQGRFTYIQALDAMTEESLAAAVSSR